MHSRFRCQIYRNAGFVMDELQPSTMDDGSVDHGTFSQDPFPDRLF